MFKRAINKTAGGGMAVVAILQVIVCVLWTLGMEWQALQFLIDGEWLTAAFISFVIVPFVGMIIYMLVGLVSALLIAPFALIKHLTEPNDETA